MGYVPVTTRLKETTVRAVLLPRAKGRLYFDALEVTYVGSELRIAPNLLNLAEPKKYASIHRELTVDKLPHRTKRLKLIEGKADLIAVVRNAGYSMTQTYLVYRLKTVTKTKTIRNNKLYRTIVKTTHLEDKPLEERPNTLELAIAAKKTIGTKGGWLRWVYIISKKYIEVTNYETIITNPRIYRQIKARYMVGKGARLLIIT